MKKGLNKISATHSLNPNSRVIDFPQTTEISRTTETSNPAQAHLEQTIETRLRSLTILVADLADSGFGALLAEEPATQEAFDELRVKESALRWIVRVAKHSSGAVREKMWRDTEDSVSSLEKTADLLMRCELILPLSSIPTHQRTLVGHRRF